MIKLLSDGPWRQPERINEPLDGCVGLLVKRVGRIDQHFVKFARVFAYRDNLYQQGREQVTF